MQGIYIIRNTNYLVKITKIDHLSQTFPLLGFVCVRSGEMIIESAWSRKGKNITSKKFDIIFYKEPKIN